MERFYVKEYIPGYTGHIQKKMGTFGITAGEINRQLVLKHQAEDRIPRERQYYMRSMSQMETDGDREKYGYRSRHGISWIGGPTHRVYPQHVPLYQGHVPGIVAENIIGKSFARCTKTAVLDKRPKGFEVPSDTKYVSSYNKGFSEKKNRRFFVEPEAIKVARDVNDFENYGGKIAPRPGSVVSPATTLARTAIPEKEHRASQFDFSATQPRWVNRDLAQEPGYQSLSNGFRKVFENSKNRDVVLPVVGYRGFMPGYAAQNMHGKAFRELAVQSKRFANLTQKAES